MTAKKKVSSTKSKAVKAKAVAVKKPAKKAASAKTKTESTKPTAAKRTTATKTKTGKSVKSPKNVTKAPVKKISKSPARNASKTKAVVKKAAPKRSKKVDKESNSISRVKEIVSKSISKSTKSENKQESNSFSFDDVLGFLKSRNKTKPKPKSSKESKDSKVTKVAKQKEKKIGKVKKLTTASIDDILGFGSPTVGVIRPLRDKSKVPKQWLPYYNALMSLRTALKGSLGERSSETIGASARESGELSINSSDAGTETFDRDLALSMVANDQEALEEIEDAIDRIFAGTYGVCLETNKPINKNRLKAVPFTRFSVDGQNQFERGKIKEKDFGSGSFATLADSTMGEEE